MGAGLEAPGTEVGATFCLRELPNVVGGGGATGEPRKLEGAGCRVPRAVSSGPCRPQPQFGVRALDLWGHGLFPFSPN